MNLLPSKNYYPKSIKNIVMSKNYFSLNQKSRKGISISNYAQFLQNHLFPLLWIWLLAPQAELCGYPGCSNTSCILCSFWMQCQDWSTYLLWEVQSISLWSLTNSCLVCFSTPPQTYLTSEIALSKRPHCSVFPHTKIKLLLR